MAGDFATLDEVDVKGLRALVRADLNVPMEQGKVSDLTRVERTAPTLRELAEKGAAVIVLSHFGRPDGKPNPDYSLEPLTAPLSAAIGRPVRFAQDCIGAAADAAVGAMKPGDVVLLENTRFHEAEEANAPEMAKALAKLGDLYVNDAFSAAHRAHASTEGVARLLPAYAGRAMELELDALDRALGHPARPVLAIVGGAKVSTKIELLGNLIDKVATLVIGGAMANTFLAAKGLAVGKSLYEPDALATAADILAAAARGHCRIILPSDAVVAKEFAANAPAKTLPVGLVPDDGMILDIGSDTIAEISRALEGSKTVVWNGPLGAFETPPFDTGTSTIARMISMLTKARRLTSVAGGGDTVAALHRAATADGISYVSTAGGAFLEWMEGKILPGVAALQRPLPNSKTNRG